MKIGLFVVRFRGDVMIRLFRSSGEERERGGGGGGGGGEMDIILMAPLGQAWPRVF